MEGTAEISGEPGRDRTLRAPGSLISWLIDWSLRNRFLVACGTLLIIAWGIWAIRHTPVDAIPDLSENQVIVFADWSGRSPQEVEDQVTYPLSTNLQGLAGVKEVRASSMFGFSLLTVVFEDKIDNYFARTRVLERLSFLQTLLPEGVTPQLGPDATGLGWVFQVLSQSRSLSRVSRRGQRLRSRYAALAAGFLHPLPVGRSRRRCRSSEHRRLCPAISGGC